ncbi:MAG: hypothetical protein E6R04_07290 [Spirochaetes bacterium]|nr:MAG: hypothetical protein E6R04_07290 [Spirochaetota bacterium]
MKLYRYLDPANNGVIEIKASRRPADNTVPRSGTWVVRERAQNSRSWVMPALPEITWHRLSQLEYLGCVQIASPKKANGRTYNRLTVQEKRERAHAQLARRREELKKNESL